jgi:hypothetical protein
MDSVEFFKPINSGNVRMIERGEQFRLPLESGYTISILGELFRQVTLVKTPSVLKILTLRASVGRLLIHDRNTFSAGFIDKILTQESNRAGPRKSRLAAATCHFESQTPSAPTEEARPLFLGLPFCNLAEMARIAHRRQARNSRPMASERVCIILEVPFKAKGCRPTRNRQRHPRFGSQNGQCESYLGKS